MLMDTTITLTQLLEATQRLSGRGSEVDRTLVDLVAEVMGLPSFDAHGRAAIAPAVLGSPKEES